MLRTIVLTSSHQLTCIDLHIRQTKLSMQDGYIVSYETEERLLKFLQRKCANNIRKLTSNLYEWISISPFFSQHVLRGTNMALH
ncbi:hypothetical protein I7I50_07654 [Histoplasma capsulatum G186AR]|uniref:Uncharacterized protein n=1 Tax=Ajellomyces capsulatus TaxID=5037 RepID=A0A8H7Z0Q8_AJECA|nr:hypothetical protein I7I52_09274 [Histoplasma capsulatum]QSS68295.1 hypothetical protein I7I50_07654 [Histoplasma capsulatum G186AR]